jgi:membrane-bound serine protease (ClpP class)
MNTIMSTRRLWVSLAALWLVVSASVTAARVAAAPPAPEQAPDAPPATEVSRARTPEPPPLPVPPAPVPPGLVEHEVPPPEGRQALVVTLEIKGAITRQTDELFSDALRAAEAQHAQALLLLLDTPGGLLDATRSIVQKTLDAPLPVITFVSPAGARAASAGLFLTLASHVAAMQTTSNIGAAHPVAAFGGDIEGNMGEKVVNDTAAWARSLAKARGRNDAWAEKAVRESVSLTASEALENQVIDLLVDDSPALLAAADGRVVMVQNRPWRVTTAGATLLLIEPTARQRLYSLLGNPALVYLLLIVGAIGLLLEFSSPGLIVPGVVGVLALGIVFGLQVLPLNAFALFLLGAAALLFIAEVYVTSFGLLGLGGLVCLAIGSYLLFDVPGSSLRLDPKLIAATLLSVLVVFFTLGYKLIQIRRQGKTTGPETWRGQSARVIEPIGPGQDGRVFFEGSIWTARSALPMARGQRCRISAVDGLLLHVEPVSDPDADALPTH